ncbi:MAG: WecB/TagA/CpsF family glycosyltransferase [Candidatus Omnitrophica bacterium]|nr:WecB/TagA/CpsF family glycosyltransferase [Candidatus Omnitrophota bacterium]
MQNPPGEFYKILGVKISQLDIRQAVSRVFAWVENRQRVYVCVAPAATIVCAQDDPEYKKVVNAAAMVTPDGMPVVWLGRWQGRRVQRVYGPDFMRAVIETGQDQGIRHYFYGGTEQTLRKLTDNIRRDFPRARIAGSWAPEMIKIKEIEKREILDKINAADPDILWIGLGSPKQDFWMAAHRGLLSVPVMAGVGAAFDFLAGVKPQAPRWLQRAGLEWLFRLSCEPRRLGKRYLVGNARFIYFLLRGVLPKFWGKEKHD